MSNIPKIEMTEQDKFLFNEFLKDNYCTTYAKWLCIIEPERSAIFDSYVEYKVNGRFVNAAYFSEEWYFGKDFARKVFSDWLHRSSAISFDCFLTLSSDLKKRIYNEFCNSSEGRMYFNKLGCNY